MGIHSEYVDVPITAHRTMRMLILWPRHQASDVPGVLWIHGGGYVAGMPEMAYLTRAIDLVEKAGVIVALPNYRLSWRKPYPAALKDCYKALLYLKENASEIGIDTDRICVGGESAGGGLTAALCMYAKDKGEVNICYQMPLYPMLDCEDTPSSRDNHEKVWDTRKNHWAWKLYLKEYAPGGRFEGQPVSCYASPSRRVNYQGLPPCYTFVGDIEPFYCETVKYVEDLRKAGVEAKIDVYPNWFHAYDINEAQTDMAKIAIRRFVEAFTEAMEKYRAPQKK